MRKKLGTLCWLLTGLLFAYDLWLWGGLALTPGIGDRLREQASLQSPIAATYLYLGRKTVDLAGQSVAARAFAESRFGEVYPELENDRYMALGRLLDAQAAAGAFAYYGAPLLLLLSLAQQVRRPRQIRSFGR